MIKKITKLIIGDMDDKRAYKAMMKRVALLPEDYKYTFKKIQKYMYSVGAPNSDISIFMDLTMFSDLIDLFEASASEGRNIIDVIGEDVSKFSNDFMLAHSKNSETRRNKLNDEIMEKFKKEDK